MYENVSSVTVKITSGGGTEYELAQFNSYDEAEEFCEEYNWQYLDSNGFVWEMFIDI